MVLNVRILRGGAKFRNGLSPLSCGTDPCIGVRGRSRRRRRRLLRRFCRRSRHAQTSAYPSTQHGAKSFKFLGTERPRLIQCAIVSELRTGRTIFVGGAPSLPTLDQRDNQGGDEQSGDERKARRQQLHFSVVRRKKKGKRPRFQSRHARLARLRSPRSRLVQPERATPFASRSIIAPRLRKERKSFFLSCRWSGERIVTKRTDRSLWPDCLLWYFTNIRRYCAKRSIEDRK